MSEVGWAAFIADHHAEESPAERSVRLARLADQRDDREAERTEAERTAALAERHEVMQLAAMQAGMVARTTNDIFTDAMRLGDEDAEYGEALKTIERIDKRRANRQRDQVERAQRMAEVGQLASRSAPTVTGGPDLLGPAKAMHRAFVETTRAKVSAAAAGTSRRERRPFSGGEVVRSHLECIFCQRENVDPETSALLHLDPQYRVPITTKAQARQEEQADQPVQAERRRTPMIYAGAEISR